MKSKLLSFMSCTPRRQQAEDVEISNTADMKSKLLSFIPCTPRRQQANNVTGNRQQTELSYAAPSRQAKLILNEEICPRTNTVKRLAEILDHERVVGVLRQQARPR